MRKITIVLGICGALAGSLVSANTEVSPELMQTIEDTTKSLDSNVAIKDAKAALAEAKELEELFKQVEAHFAQKNGTPDAVAFSQKSKGFASEVAKFVEANDFDAASKAVNSLAKSCKTCHEIYKK